MEIASCSRNLARHPRFNPRPRGRSSSCPLSSLPLSCRRNVPGLEAPSPLLRTCQSHSLDGRGSWICSFKFGSSSLSAMGDATIVTNDYTGELPSNLLGSDDALANENEPENSDGFGNVKTDSNCLTDHKMVKVCDKLIEVFMIDKPTATDWRRLLAFSKEWGSIRPHFYKRCQERADSESNPEMKHKILRLSRKLKEIDDDVQRHNELLNLIKETPKEISAIVSKRRKDFTKEFFVHFHTIVESYFENPEEQNALAKLANDCLAAVHAYDNASESIQAVEAAELKLQDIINSPSVDEACRKIDDLAEKKQLDSALMLMLTKAWSAAKESNMMRDEAKDILYHLYKTAVGNMQRLMPKEIRILKYLLTIEDPELQLSSLIDAFTPGVELEGKDVDCLFTTPEKLHTWIKTVLDAYHFSREGTLIREARDLMNPKIIQKLENLKKLVQDHFL
ncbi:Uncharacterized protein AXF42_Ash012746 [Apostasia shenzhenica]|uniref:Uncharacterized protein n=1 Tax=Apostasia shenzhenica TaxID=1088818 RepID=A0A2I0AMC2_9ASPA|nr:Uncharacterized protein AXF42_Ash012746 [Apostasia shenzhenica]